jgi:putative transposase
MVRSGSENKFLVRSKYLKQHRHSLRLEGYDYAQVGAYFITVVTHRRTCLFGRILNGELMLNTAGQMVQSIWNELPAHFSKMDLDTFVVMPNHIHGIIHITDGLDPSEQAQHAAPLQRSPSFRQNVPPGSLGAIVRSFKSAVTKRYNEKHAPSGLGLWQRNYYEHVIRDENSLIRIRRYIATNPARWSIDPENPFATRQESKDIWRVDDNRTTVGAQHAAPLPAAGKM